MITTQEERGGIVSVTIRGGMETELAPEFEKTIRGIFDSDRRRLLVDLGGLEYLRSSVLRVILSAAKQVSKKSGKVALCCLNRYVKEIFELNCFRETIAIADSCESGIEELSGRLNAVV